MCGQRDAMTRALLTVLLAPTVLAGLAPAPIAQAQPRFAGIVLAEPGTLDDETVAREVIVKDVPGKPVSSLVVERRLGDTTPRDS